MKTEPGSKRWLCLFVLAFLPFMGTLDVNIVNVALPTIARDFGVSMAEVEWVATVYLMAISATILIFGRLGDIKGKARIFNIGFALFSAGSLLCGLAESFSFLIVARVVQSIGAACTMGTNQGIITQLFAPHERGRALGISGMAVALGTMTGAPLGGLIISVTKWQGIFLVNVPVGILASVLAFVILPKEEQQKGEKLDKKGSLLYFFAVALLLLTFNLASRLSSLAVTFSGFALSAALLLFFLYVERRTENPLLDIRIFKNKQFSLSIFCAFIAFTSFNSINIIHPFYLQDVLLLTAGAAGLFMMISPVVMFITSPLSGYMSDRFGSEGLTCIGLLTEAAGLFCLSTLKEASPLALIGCFIGMSALGAALFQSPNHSLTMSAVPREQLGVAGSVNALVRNLGMTFGILISTGVLYNRMSAFEGHKVTAAAPGAGTAAFIYGMHAAYLIASLICLIGAVLTGIRLLKKRRQRVSEG